MMKIVLANKGIQTAILAAALGVALQFLGMQADGSILIGASVTYIAGKLQRRPHTVMVDKAIDAAMEGE